MQEFQVMIRSFQDLRAFVTAAGSQPFPISVSDSQRQVNGSSYIAMVCLNHKAPLTVQCRCTEQQCRCFRDQLRCAI